MLRKRSGRHARKFTRDYDVASLRLLSLQSLISPAGRHWQRKARRRNSIRHQRQLLPGPQVRLRNAQILRSPESSCLLRWKVLRQLSERKRCSSDAGYMAREMLHIPRVSRLGRHPQLATSTVWRACRP